MSNISDENFDCTKNPTYLERHKRSLFFMPQCKNCEAIAICGGGCALSACENGSSIWDLDEGFCIHTKDALKFLIWDLFEKIDK